MKPNAPPAMSSRQRPTSFWDRIGAPWSNAGFKASAFYRLWLTGPLPRGIQCAVPQIWPGDPDRGRALLNGSFGFSSETYQLESPRALPERATDTWLQWFHGHGWLKDLAALGGGEAPYFAREWLNAWIDEHDSWDAISWAPEITAERLVNWCQSWSFIVRDEGGHAFEKKLRRTVGRDARHLFKSLPSPAHGFARLHALKGQIFAAFALFDSDSRKAQTLERLKTELKTQVLPDGGHVERSPAILIDVLQDLLELKALLSVATGDVPRDLQNAIDRIAPMIRTLRHPDGGLAVFNGGWEHRAPWIDLLLAQTDSTAKPPQNAPHTGFQHLSAGPVHVIMDCGQPTAVGHHQHAGTLGFEMSSGKHRLIVNCGGRNEPRDPWRTALAATAAHSTLSVNDTSSAAFTLDGRLASGPQNVQCARHDVDQGVLIEANHDGYADNFGLTHHRALFLAAHGTDLRGEDRLVGTGGARFTIRFHLHPKVKASLLGDGHGILLRLSGNDVWRFRTSADDIKLEESVYLGHGADVRRTEQIVISGPLSGNGALVKWALSRDAA